MAKRGGGDRWKERALSRFWRRKKVHKPLFSSTLWDTHLACSGSISLIGYVSPTIFASLRSIHSAKNNGKEASSFFFFFFACKTFGVYNPAAPRYGEEKESEKIPLCHTSVAQERAEIPESEKQSPLVIFLLFLPSLWCQRRVSHRARMGDGRQCEL